MGTPFSNGLAGAEVRESVRAVASGAVRPRLLRLTASSDVEPATPARDLRVGNLGEPVWYKLRVHGDLQLCVSS